MQFDQLEFYAYDHNGNGSSSVKDLEEDNPIFYFGLIGALITLCGFGIGIFIVTEWFKKIDHIPLTILAMMLVIAGLQIFMFGIQSDMLLAYQREMLHEIQDLREEVGTGNKSLNE